jgi:Lon protease-like protein
MESGAVAAPPPVMLSDLPLFPLGIVLLPDERLPLHIFEPRYRDLVARCEQADEPFAIVLQDETGVRDTACTARITHVLERMPDGRSNILVQGEQPVRLLELLDVRSYRTAVADPLRDTRREADLDAQHAALAAYGALGESADDLDLPEAPLVGPHLSYRLAGRVGFGPEVKQLLLEERDEGARVDEVTRLLAEVRRGLVLAAEAQSRARRNGRVRLPEELAAELGL